MPGAPSGSSRCACPGRGLTGSEAGRASDREHRGRASEESGAGTGRLGCLVVLDVPIWIRPPAPPSRSRFMMPAELHRGETLHPRQSVRMSSSSVCAPALRCSRGRSARSGHPAGASRPRRSAGRAACAGPGEHRRRRRTVTCGQALERPGWLLCADPAGCGRARHAGLREDCLVRWPRSFDADDEDAALRIANDSRFGLAAVSGPVTPSAASAPPGAWPAVAPSSPPGQERSTPALRRHQASGYGRELGAAGIQELVTSRRSGLVNQSDRSIKRIGESIEQCASETRR